MKLLLDTHAFLFAIAEPELLTAKTRRLLTNPSVERWVSAVSLWEIAVKVHIGKLAMPLDRAFYTQHLQALKANTLAVSLQHSLALLELPLHHRDPFDRLLIAQAREEGLTLVTRDIVSARTRWRKSGRRWLAAQMCHNYDICGPLSNSRMNS